MKVFHNPLHRQHAGRQEMYRGRLVPCHEVPERLDHVLAELGRRPVGPLLEPAPLVESGHALSKLFLVGSMAAGKRFLNLFCYTAVFTLHARKGGAAATTSVDLSKTYLGWAERNHQMNGFALGGPHRLVHADCLQWLERDPEPGDAYDLIVCDPPTFSNSKRMRADSFSIDRDWTWLLDRIRGLLAPGGTAFFSTNSRRFPFEPAAVPEGLHVREITRQTLPEDFRETRIHRCFRVEHKRAAAAGEPGVSMAGS